jgi:hypothetical protein
MGSVFTLFTCLLNQKISENRGHFAGPDLLLS